MQYTEKLSWILDKKGKTVNEEKIYQQNIDFVHSLGKKCDCVGWSELSSADPDFDEVLSEIDRFCKADSWLARGYYEREYIDVESDWFEMLTTNFSDSAIADYVNAPTQNGEEILLTTIKAFRENSLSPKEQFGICVPERLKNSLIDNNVKNVDFCWVQDRGKYEAEQYFYIYPKTLIPQILTNKNLDINSNERISTLGGKLPRIAEVFSQLQDIILPDCYLAEDMPDGGIAYAYIPETDTFCGRHKILIHKDTAEKLLLEKAISSKYLKTVPIVKTCPNGYVITKTQAQIKPTDEYINDMLSRYIKIKSSSRPAYIVSEKDAIKALKSAQSHRKEDFSKKLSKRLAEQADSNPLSPYYQVANGGLLSDEFTFLSFEESKRVTDEFYKELEKEELLQEKPQGTVFCKCADGDFILMLNDETVIRFSHEAPEIIGSWQNLAEFFYDAITNNY